MRPYVELPRNMGLFVTPGHYIHVYTVVAIFSDRGFHV
jgi:hypothetical protein